MALRLITETEDLQKIKDKLGAQGQLRELSPDEAKALKPVPTTGTGEQKSRASFEFIPPGGMPSYVWEDPEMSKAARTGFWEGVFMPFRAFQQTLLGGAKAMKEGDIEEFKRGLKAGVSPTLMEVEPIEGRELIPEYRSPSLTYTTDPKTGEVREFEIGEWKGTPSHPAQMALGTIEQLPREIGGAIIDLVSDPLILIPTIRAGKTAITSAYLAKKYGVEEAKLAKYLTKEVNRRVLASEMHNTAQMRRGVRATEEAAAAATRVEQERALVGTLREVRDAESARIREAFFNKAEEVIEAPRPRPEPKRTLLSSGGVEFQEPMDFVEAVSKARAEAPAAFARSELEKTARIFPSAIPKTELMYSPSQVDAAKMSLVSMQKSGVIGKKQTEKMLEILKQPGAIEEKGTVEHAVDSFQRMQKARQEIHRTEKLVDKGRPITQQFLAEQKRIYNEVKKEWSAARQAVVGLSVPKGEAGFARIPTKQDFQAMNDKIKKAFMLRGLAPLTMEEMDYVTRKVLTSSDDVQARLLKNPLDLHNIAKVAQPKVKAAKVASQNVTQAHAAGISKGQIAKIHMLKDALKLEDTAYKEFLLKQTGKESSTLLDSKEASKVIGRMERWKKHGTFRPTHKGDIELMSTEQETTLRELNNNLVKGGVLTESDVLDIAERTTGRRKLLTYDEAAWDKGEVITNRQFKEALRETSYEVTANRISRPGELAARNHHDPQLRARFDLETKDIERYAFERELKGKPIKPRRFESNRYYHESLEQRIDDQRLVPLYNEMIKTERDITVGHSELWHRVAVAVDSTNPKRGSKLVERWMKHEKSMQRVDDYIQSTLKLKGAPKAPTLTKDELTIAESLKNILKEYESKVRVRKFLDYFYDPINHPIRDYAQHQDEINTLRDVWVKSGFNVEMLNRVAQRQSWGVIGSGYSPWETLFGIQVSKTPAGAIGKGRILSRGSIEFVEQERTLAQRLGSYFRQMDYGVYLNDKIVAYENIVNRNLHKLPTALRNKVEDASENFLRELLHRNADRGFVKWFMSHLYGQAARSAITVNFRLPGYNVIQFLMHPEPWDFVKFTNKRLSKRASDFYYRYADSIGPISADYTLKQYGLDKIFSEIDIKAARIPEHIIRNVNQIADKVKLFPWSDRASRIIPYWAKWNRVQRFGGAYEKGLLTFDEFWNRINPYSMSPIQRREGLKIYAKNGLDDFSEYVAKNAADDKAFLYATAERSPMEMGTAGKAFWNLALFPRAYVEQGVKSTQTAIKGLFRGNWPEARQGIKSLIAQFATITVVGEGVRRVLGLERNPWSPLNILTFEAGGLYWRSAQAVTEVFSSTLEALDSTNSERLRRLAVMRLPKLISQTNDLFVPFYQEIMQMIESGPQLIGADDPERELSNLDVALMRQVITAFREDYEMRPDAYKIDRSTREAWQHLIGGSGIDATIREREAEAKRKRKSQGFPTE